MSFSIDLSSSPQFSFVTALPAIQDWNITATPGSNAYFYPGNAMPADIVLDIQVKDYPQANTNNDYVSFIIKPEISSTGTSAPFFTRTSDINPNGSDLSTSLNYQDTFSFQNLNSLPPPSIGSSYIIIAIYRVYGVTSSGTEVLIISKINYLQVFYITGNFIIITTPSPLVYTHIVGDALPPAQTVNIEADSDYLLEVNEKFDLVGYTQSTFVINGFRLYNTSGPQTLQVKPNSKIEDTPDKLFEETIVRISKSYDDQGNEIDKVTDSIDVQYIALSSGVPIIDPPALYFFLVKDFSDNTTTQSFNVFSTDASTLSGPVWATLSTTSLAGSGSIDVSISSADNFNIGIYQENIVVNFGSNTIDVPVTVEVVENIRLNLLQDGLNFTLENTKFTELFSANTNADANINLEVDQIGYQLTKPETFSFEYKTGFFNNRSKIHIGEIVDRSLKSINLDDLLAITFGLSFFNQPTRSIAKYYKPAKIKLDLEIVSPVDQSVLSSESFNFLRFVAGRKPHFRNNIAFLSYDRLIQRVTQSSKILFNYLSLSKGDIFVGDPQALYFYKNQQLLASASLNSPDYELHAMLIKFDGFTPGDKLLISTDSDHFNTDPFNLSSPLTQEYIVFPECEHQNTILYEDEYKCLRAFDFTGEWRFTSNYERFTSSSYKNLVKTIALDDTVKEQSLNIHTGYVPRDNQVIVDQIKRAKKAWLLSDDNRSVVELVPNNEEHLNYDSDNDLYDYELNFIINKKHDLQNYS